jgi:hypothetical protein
MKGLMRQVDANVGSEDGGKHSRIVRDRTRRFITRLSKKYPKLCTELKVCALLKIGLATKDPDIRHEH